ncbi:hypothetical protein HJG60_010397 [Phyllostomus discolor]|uniref:Uncharacterized protein n=1 Tax=Phyllostomus discolor TaxID=89673 RepID=A0A834EK00_9CHIR|nr:hypothetical protein HJG60_010397 [Phyllostomus discolor]
MLPVRTLSVNQYIIQVKLSWGQGSYWKHFLRFKRGCRWGTLFQTDASRQPPFACIGNDLPSPNKCLYFDFCLKPVSERNVFPFLILHLALDLRLCEKSRSCLRCRSSVEYVLVMLVEIKMVIIRRGINMAISAPFPPD